MPYANNQKVIRLITKNGIEEDVSLDIEDDSHRKYFYRSILGNEEIYSFKKSPLVSSSLKHPGSMFNSYGSIYKFSEYSRYNKMRSISKNINIILAIIEEKINEEFVYQSFGIVGLESFSLSSLRLTHEY